MLRLVVFGALAAIVSGETTQVSRCTINNGELPVNAYIAGCDVPPCALPQLENAVIKIIFKAPRTMRSMTTLATAYLPVLGIPIPIPYPLGDQALTCNFLDNSYCPVLEGEIIQYTLLMFIQTSFQAGLAPTIEFRVADDNNVQFVCIRVPIIILPPRSSLAGNATLVDDAH